MKKLKRCEEAIVQFVIRTYDENGMAIQEQASQQTKMFRAKVPDVWKEIDDAINKETKE